MYKNCERNSFDDVHCDKKMMNMHYFFEEFVHGLTSRRIFIKVVAKFQEYVAKKYW